MPNWSPDGSKIAFVSFLDGGDDIYVMNTDGSGQIRLTNNTADDICPVWSPDGTMIAFASSDPNIDNGAREIYVMNADGSAQTRITNNTADDWEPDCKFVHSPVTFPQYMSSLMDICQQ